MDRNTRSLEQEQPLELDLVGGELERVKSGKKTAINFVSRCCFFLFIMAVYELSLLAFVYTFSIAPVTCYVTVTVNGLPFFSASLTAWLGAIMVFLIKKLLPLFFLGYMGFF